MLTHASGAASLRPKGGLMIRNVILITLAVVALLAAVTGVAYFLSREEIRTHLASVAPQGPANGYLVLQLDSAQLRRDIHAQLSDTLAERARTANPIIRYSGRGAVADAARVQLADPSQAEHAFRALASPDYTLSVSPEGMIEARINATLVNDALADATEYTIGVLQRRLDALAVRTYQVSVSAPGRILVQGYGNADFTAVRNVIEPTGSMSFHMVRELSPDEVSSGNLPPGTMLAPPYFTENHPEVVERRAQLTGDHIVRSNPSADTMTGELVLAFGLDSEGRRRFCRITTENVGHRFAILLDGRVITAPTINEPICGGSGQISGNFTPQSVNEFAIILSAGSFPAPLTVLEQGAGAAPQTENTP